MREKKFGQQIFTNIKDSKLIEKRHEQIFKAATKLFGKKGYYESGIRDLSKETGISLGNLYNYIRAKEDVLYIVHKKGDELIEKQWQSLENMNQKTLSISNPAEKLKRMIGIELDTVNKYQDIIMLIYQESHALNKKYLKLMLDKETAHVKKFQKVLEEGANLGIFKNINPGVMAHVIKMMIDCWVLKRWALHSKVSLRQMRESIIKIVFQGIMENHEQGP